MAVTQKEKQVIDTIKLEPMQDNITILDENTSKYKIDRELLKSLYLEKIKNGVMFTKVNTLDDDIINLKARVTELEQGQGLWTKAGHNPFRGYEEERRKPDVKRADRSDSKSTLQECEKIVGRVNEILAEWGETQEIKSQIQYAALIVAKIENIKKKDFIQKDEIRKKNLYFIKSSDSIECYR